MPIDKRVSLAEALDGVSDGATVFITGFGGAVLIFSPWQAVSGLASIGAIECLAAAASYALSYVYMDRFLARRGIGPVVLSACQLGAAVLLAPREGPSGWRSVVASPEAGEVALWEPKP